MPSRLCNIFYVRLIGQWHAEEVASYGARLRAAAIHAWHFPKPEPALILQCRIETPGIAAMPLHTAPTPHFKYIGIFAAIPKVSFTIVSTYTFVYMLMYVGMLYKRFTVPRFYFGSPLEFDIFVVCSAFIGRNGSLQINYIAFKGKRHKAFKLFYCQYKAYDE